LPFTFVTPALSRGPASFSFTLNQLLKQILPFGIAPLDQRKLPLATPSLHTLLMCDAGVDIFRTFRPDQPGEAIARAEVRAIATAS
jgi:hypothetical protein